jgi:hypothetical protein
MRTIYHPVTMMAIAAMNVANAYADDNPKAVWGGGPAAASAYTAAYVPRVIEVLEAQHLSGYTWGGVSAGTIANAEMITNHPTNLAVGQLDLFNLIKDQPIAGLDGAKYQFTIVKPDMGPECLYLVTNDANYKTFGDVLGNGWQLSVVTGGEKSGSFVTWEILREIYPDLKSMLITHVPTTDNIISAVKQSSDKIGFFVMRPDPDSEIFKSIAAAELTIVPVVDFDLEGKYQFLSLKVSHGWSGGKEVQTACTSVALITGDLTSTKFANENDKRRLAETIKRLQGVDGKAFQPSASGWRDMWDSIASYSSDKTKSLMEASKKALTDLKKAHGG